MRILQLTSHLDIGGITRYVLALSDQLMKRGHRVVLASDGGHLEAHVRAMGLRHWRLPLHTSAECSLQVFRGIRQLTRLLKEEPVDIIHAHTRVGQVVAACVSRRLPLPFVTTWHGIYTPRLGRRLWPCTGERTIAISELVRQHLLRTFQVPAQHVRCIYNGIDAAHYARSPDAATVQAYRTRWQISAARPVIGAIGRLAAGRVKGLDTFLVAVSVLEEAVPDLQVLIVGEGPRRPFLEDIAGRLGVRSRVSFVGEAEDIRLPLALMDVFVFTSRWPEAFGLTLVEAMAAGKPVVATRAGAVPQILEHGRQGLLVEPENPQAIAEAVATLLRDPAAAASLGQAAQERVRERFTLERMADEVEAVYREVVR